MKILYGVQGTGNGHIARTKALLPELKKSGVHIDFVFSGRKQEDFFDMQEFGQYRLFSGLTLFCYRGRMQLLKTITKNNLVRFVLDIIRLDISSYDLVISDFEPITSWSAKLHNVDCIELSHQSAFNYDIPKEKGYFFSKILMKIFSPNKTKVGFHYHHFNQPILPPLITRSSETTQNKKKIVVYMGFEELKDVVKLVEPFSDFEFSIFAKVEKSKTIGHIKINPLSHEEFHLQLNKCEGVICNAGFELSSEALHMGKKLLVKPVDGQYEQLCNVVALEKLGKGMSMTNLDQNILKEWLNTELPEPINYPLVAGPLANWLLNPNRCSLEKLSQEIWNQS
jgi:uncharacterized protein (TIGR00661 family)